MNTTSGFELTPNEKELFEKLIEKLWTYFNDIGERNEQYIIPKKFMERFRSIDELRKWVGNGMPLNE